MAYFSNSSEAEIFENECSDCPLGDKDCPIALTQYVYNYEACNNEIASNILNGLIKQKKNGEYIGCQMKPIIEQLPESK